ncbi:VOC family protein, partial [Parvibaculum sp.]|uniref:VOC family protein n=1 Tax=Parvibaculum sp. TaxID=2024848 RepID=UPI002CF3D669
DNIEQRLHVADTLAHKNDLLDHLLTTKDVDQAVVFTSTQRDADILAEMPSPSGCIHVMVEVNSIDEVGRALDRVQQHQVPMLMGLGRHVNDEMISFYIFTPGMFALEYGWGGLVKDWTEHQVFETTSPSHWGHRLGG